MKPLLLLSTLSVLLLLVSCKKYNPQQYDQGPQSPRTIRFALYTDKDFSDNNSNVTFKVFIQSSNVNTIWDSTFAPMRIKDIPAFANRLVAEKTVTVPDRSVLKVGFRYYFDDGSNSQYIDTSSAYQTSKDVNYNFQ